MKTIEYYPSRKLTPQSLSSAGFEITREQGATYVDRSCIIVPGPDGYIYSFSVIEGDTTGPEVVKKVAKKFKTIMVKQGEPDLRDRDTDEAWMEEVDFSDSFG